MKTLRQSKAHKIFISELQSFIFDAICNFLSERYWIFMMCLFFFVHQNNTEKKNLGFLFQLFGSENVYISMVRCENTATVQQFCVSCMCAYYFYVPDSWVFCFRWISLKIFWTYTNILCSWHFGKKGVFYCQQEQECLLSFTHRATQWNIPYTIQHICHLSKFHKET